MFAAKSWAHKRWNWQTHLPTYEFSYPSTEQAWRQTFMFWFLFILQIKLAQTWIFSHIRFDIISSALAPVLFIRFSLSLSSSIRMQYNTSCIPFASIEWTFCMVAMLSEDSKYHQIKMKWANTHNSFSFFPQAIINTGTHIIKFDIKLIFIGRHQNEMCDFDVCNKKFGFSLESLHKSRAQARHFNLDMRVKCFSIAFLNALLVF